MAKYDPAKKLIERHPRYDKPTWVAVHKRPTLTCGCGQVCFLIQKTPMQRQRRTMDASHRKIVAVCLNPACKQEIRLD